MIPMLRLVPAPTEPVITGQIVFPFLRAKIFTHRQLAATRGTRRVLCKAAEVPEQQLPLRPRAPAPPRAPIRPPALRAYAPRKMMDGARPRSLGPDQLTAAERLELHRDEVELVALGIYERRADGSVGWGRLAPLPAMHGPRCASAGRGKPLADDGGGLP